MPNNNPNYTPQNQDTYQLVSDQMAPPISKLDMAVGQPMAQPQAQPLYQHIAQQAPLAQPTVYNNAPLYVPPPIQNRRRRVIIKIITFVVFFVCVLVCIIICVRFFTNGK